MQQTKLYLKPLLRSFLDPKSGGYRLYPRKGTIAIGSDADLGIWNPNQKVTITNERLHHNVDYTPYEGMQIRGYPEITLSRAEVVWQDGKLQATPGRGLFLPSLLARPKVAPG